MDITEWYPDTYEDIWSALQRIDETLRHYRAAAHEWLEPEDMYKRVREWDMCMTTKNDVIIAVQDNVVLKPAIFADPPALGTFLWTRELLVHIMGKYPQIREQRSGHWMCMHYWLVIARGDDNDCRMGESPYYNG